jgi:Family of unknown function (DUF5947)
MAAEPIQPRANAFAALQRFVRRNTPEERCELCGDGLATRHEHLIEPANRRLVCACQACAILFSGQSGQRYKRVPQRVRFLPDFRMTDAQWDSLMVPINMAFFFRSSTAGKMIAIYPSPAGATESLLPLETWDEIVAENPELRSMESDVDALLVNRLGTGRGFPMHQYFLLPIDECFHLVGLVRANWRGLSGGDELWRELESHFASLTARAGFVAEPHHA